VLNGVGEAWFITFIIMERFGWDQVYFVVSYLGKLDIYVEGQMDIALRLSIQEVT